MIKFEYLYFVAPKEIIALDNGHPGLLKPSGERHMDQADKIRQLWSILTFQTIK